MMQAIYHAELKPSRKVRGGTNKKVGLYKGI